MDEGARRDVAERAKAIYEAHIRPLVEGEHFGKELLVEVDSGDYEIVRDRDDYFEASRRLRERHPGSQGFLMRIGYRAAARLGGARWRSDVP